jgi:hypothetical protein
MKKIILAALLLTACASPTTEPGVDAGAEPAARIKGGGITTQCYADTRRWQIWLGEVCYVEDCCTATLVPPTLNCYTQRVDGYACHRR